MGKPSIQKPTPKAKKAVGGSAKSKTSIKRKAPAGCETYRPLIAKYDWDVRIAMAVMQAESGCNPESDNTGLNSDGTNDKGLFQINSIHIKSGLIADKQRKDPVKNIKAAYAIYRGSGWMAWSAYNNGSYTKFLK